ncbi:hypothetical protein DLJ49_02085 [Rhodovulum sp. 12E13]|uniref:hypothetical protein n=1 Tax=Rhodovulum sp. 12E13 TaxID=2203891 RepID=UPI000E1908C3|nr:hypothetical protein [Rhodovulum sp. 12E13]RDC74794.1 hypothetical protein DLJ49_02085 [Rhodovulum sp. 12E13]
MPAPPDFHVARMASLSLAGSGRARPIRVPEEHRAPGFGAAYDFDTLWYDAVRIGGVVHLVCPRLYDLRPLLDTVEADGQRLRPPRVRRSRRHEIATLAAPKRAERLSLALRDWQADCAISDDAAGHFAGLNASLHISRDNRPEWLADWARFHVAEHGLQAMLVMDNASDYPPDAILDALAPTGLERAVVLVVPQPYGPTRGKSGKGGAKFLQPAMLNLARLRFLRRARAVLNVDIDELVWAHGGSVFDAAVKSPLGLVSFAGEWRQPPPRTAPPFIHAQHVHTRTGEWPCPTKYCIRPDGPLRWAGWDVHRPDTALPVGLRPRRDMGYWHCRGITTDWKGYGRLKPGDIGPRDASTAAILERALGTCALAGPPHK